MRLPSTLTLSALFSLLTTQSAAQHTVDSLSFGHTTPFSSTGSTLPGWTLSGTADHLPKILSDRIVLTPPAPGNKRGALWSDHTLTYPEWIVDVEFRASGPERGSGNLQIWLTKEKLPTAASVYTVERFDGLVVELDQYAGSAGAVRGFLNDGSVSFKGHHNVDGLSFGHCDYAYRNLGRMSRLRVKQAHDGFEVLMDDRSCFKTNQVRIPQNYYFGITAASAENPDSFELSKFTVSTTNSITRDEPRRADPPAQQQDADIPPPPSPNQEPQPNDATAQQQQQQPQSPANPPQSPNERNFMPGRTGSNPPDYQFYELLNRLEVTTNNINNVYRELKAVDDRLQQRHDELLGEVTSNNANTPLAVAQPPPPQIKDNTDLLISISRRLENVERSLSKLQESAGNQDYKEHLTGLHNTLRDTRDNLMESFVGRATVASTSPGLWGIVGVVAGSQFLLGLAYVIYKRRRGRSSKKIL